MNKEMALRQFPLIDIDCGYWSHPSEIEKNEKGNNEFICKKDHLCIWFEPDHVRSFLKKKNINSIVFGRHRRRARIQTPNYCYYKLYCAHSRAWPRHVQQNWINFPISAAFTVLFVRRHVIFHVDVDDGDAYGSMRIRSIRTVHTQ